MSIILTTQTPSPGGAQYETTLQILSGDTTTVDAIAFSVTAAAKWFLTATVDDKIRFLEVSGVCHISKTPIQTIFGDVGDRIAVKPILSQTPTGLTLSIINNEAQTVSISVARMHATTV